MEAETALPTLASVVDRPFPLDECGPHLWCVFAESNGVLRLRSIIAHVEAIVRHLPSQSAILDESPNILLIKELIEVLPTLKRTWDSIAATQCKARPGSADVRFSSGRLGRLLGLPTSADIDVLVEFFVRMDDDLCAMHRALDAVFPPC